MEYYLIEQYDGYDLTFLGVFDSLDIFIETIKSRFLSKDIVITYKIYEKGDPTYDSNSIVIIGEDGFSMDEFVYKKISINEIFEYQHYALK